MKTIWIGVVTGVFVESTKENLRTGDLSNEQRRTLTLKLKEMDCYPVFVGTKVHVDFNIGFCKSVLWPLLHNAQALTHLNEQMRDYKKYWLGYQRVNQLIAARVTNLYEEGDFIWINDYICLFCHRPIRKGCAGVGHNRNLLSCPFSNFGGISILTNADRDVAIFLLLMLWDFTLSVTLDTS